MTQKQIGHLRLADRANVIFTGLVAQLPDGAKLDKDAIGGLFDDARVMATRDLPWSEREMRAFVKFLEQTGSLPKPAGIAKRYGLAGAP